MVNLLLSLILAINVTTSIKYSTDNQELSVNDIYSVFSDLKKATGEYDKIPDLTIENSSQINAWANRDRITITTGMIKFIKNKDELAAVLGHEIGHIILSHLTAKFKDDSRILEANADKIGIFLMLRENYNPCAAKEFWLRIADQQSDNIVTSSHPSHMQRAYELDLPMRNGRNL